MLPQQFLKVDEPGGVICYTFPQRDLGRFRWLGLLFLFISALIVAIPIAFVGFSLPAVLNQPVALGVSLLILGVMVYFSRWPYRLGQLIRRGYTELRLSETEVTVMERAPGVRWERRFPTSRLARLKVVPLTVSSGGKPTGLDFAVLVAGEHRRNSHLVAIGYPENDLNAFAAEIAAETERLTLTTPQPVKVEICDRPVDESHLVDSPDLSRRPAPERWDRPAESRIHCENAADGLVFTVPPAGLWRATYGFFGFALFFNLVIGGVGAVFFAVWFFGDQKGPSFLWLPLSIISLMMLVGLGLLVASVNMARRRAVVAIVGGKLMLLQTGIFGSRRQEWPLQDIANVRPHPSGMTVNNVPVLELHIATHEHGSVGILAGQPTADLEWMATLLREEIRRQTGQDALAGEAPA